MERVESNLDFFFKNQLNCEDESENEISYTFSKCKV